MTGSFQETEMPLTASKIVEPMQLCDYHAAVN